MREAISGTWLFQLVIVFILLFVGYLTLSLNYSKSFRVKNEVISIIEREEGMTSGVSTEYGAVGLIANYLKNSGYSTKGKCPTDENTEYGTMSRYTESSWFGVDSLDATNIESNTSNLLKPADKNTEYYYCVKKIWGYYPKESQIAYYKVQLFFHFDLPVFGSIAKFRVTGQTIDIQYPQDKDFDWIR